MMQKRRAGTIITTAVAYILLPPCAAMANGYNRIHEVAVPFLVLIFSLLYPLPALIPAAAVYLVLRKAVSPVTPSFLRCYAGAVIGGDTGIAVSYVFSIRVAGPGWNSYHYTLYPWLILGLSVMGALALALAGVKKK